MDEYAKRIWSVIDTLRSKCVSDDFIEEAVLALTRGNPDPMAMVMAHRIVREMRIAPVAGRIS